MIWAAPLLIIIALGALTWISTHTLDPYRPLDRIDAQRGRCRPTPSRWTVEVVALDWKWLFIYPEQGIATVNELAAPVDRPISFKITASSVMNSFYVPALAGLIYAMPGMETKLHAVINKPGDFEGFSANYSGAGFSRMRFKFHGLSQADFDDWVAEGQGRAAARSTATAYLQLEKPSETRAGAPLSRPSTPGLFDAILNLLRRARQDVHERDDGTSTARAAAAWRAMPTGSGSTTTRRRERPCRRRRRPSTSGETHSDTTDSVRTAARTTAPSGRPRSPSTERGLPAHSAV